MSEDTLNSIAAREKELAAYAAETNRIIGKREALHRLNAFRENLKEEIALSKELRSKMKLGEKLLKDVVKEIDAMGDDETLDAETIDGVISISAASISGCQEALTPGNNLTIVGSFESSDDGACCRLA